MTISDETLMAYADGELDAAARQAVESAMRADPQLAARVAQHRALRLQVQAAYAAELSDEVPERLLRAARRAAADRTAARGGPLQRQWRVAGTMAASVIIGVGVGFFIWGRGGAPLVRNTGGTLVAGGQLATALSSQLAAESSNHSSVQIGLSFLAKSGDYCRTFVLSGAVPQSGLACRRAGEWQIQALAQVPNDATGAGEYRTAGSATPEMILKLVEGRMAGEALDQAQERAARERDWKTKEH
jgi:hypothetical protein